MTERVFGGIADDIVELIAFMNGPDKAVLKRLVAYVSLDGRYCHPRELKRFWESLTESEKNYYRKCVVQRII